MPKFTVITINFNNKAGIQRTIRSVSSQTLRDFEYIIIDGGSTDGGLEVIQEFSDRITYWVSEADRGIYDAMNKGLKASTGELVYFLNSGDYFFNEDTLLHLTEAIAKEETCELYYGNILLVNDKGPVGFINFKNMDLFHLMQGMISHQTIIARRSVFERYGYFDTSFKIGGDYNWLLNLFIRKSVKKSHVDLTIACYLTGGISEVNVQVHEAERERVRQKYFSRMANLFSDWVHKFKIYRFLRRSWIVSVINGLSYYKWKALGNNQQS